MLSGLRYLRSQRRRRAEKEGMALTQGPVTGELPPALLPIEEHGMKLLVDIGAATKPVIILISATVVWRRAATWKISGY